VRDVAANAVPPQPKPVAGPPEPAPRDPMPRIVAFAGTGALALAVLGVAAAATYRRKDTT
jgi:membrane-anchored mycosin MYCP